MSQKELFAESTMQTKHCERCGMLCQVGPASDAEYFRRGTAQTGRFCANCLITHFVKHFDLGPMSSLGAEQIEKMFPDCLKMPHIQEQMERIASFGDAPAGEIDWETVIANWDLPFAEEKQGRRRKRSHPSRSKSNDDTK